MLTSKSQTKNLTYEIFMSEGVLISKLNVTKKKKDMKKF